MLLDGANTKFKCWKGPTEKPVNVGGTNAKTRGMLEGTNAKTRERWDANEHTWDAKLCCHKKLLGWGQRKNPCLS
jgi:hypothetical protein